MNYGMSSEIYDKGSARLIAQCVEINNKDVLNKYLKEVIDYKKSLQSVATLKEIDEYCIIVYPEHANNNLIDVIFIKNNKLYQLNYSNYAKMMK